MRDFGQAEARFFGLIVALALLLLPDAAQAGGLSASVTQVGLGINELPNIISFLAYIFGASMVVAGVFKLRAHVENPLQEPIQKGVVRLVIGAALASLPSLIGWAQSSILVGGANGPPVAAYQALGVIP